MSKQGVLIETLDIEAQLIWTASGDEIVGKGAHLWCAYTGQREDAMRDWGWLEALHPEDRERVRQLWWQAMEQKRFYETWYRVRNHDGVYHAFLLRCMPILDDNGTLKEWVSQLAPQREEQEAAALADQFKAVFEAMADGVLFCDVNGKILLLNTAGYRLMELGEADLTGEDYQTFIPFYKVVDKHRRPLSIEQVPLSRILHGEVFTSEQAEDVIIQLPSGREEILGISGTPLYDRQGHIVGGICIFRDITESRLKEQHAQQALNALVTIVEKVSLLPIQSDTAPIQSLYAVGQALAEIVHQVLQCQFAACILKKPQANQLDLAGVSGFSAEEERIYREEIERSFEYNYLNAELTCLNNNNVVIRDLVAQPYEGPLPDFGIRYRLMAPMLLHEQLVGLLVIGKSGADVVYPPEEIALAKAIGKLIVHVIERARLTNEWMAARTNELALSEANRRFDAFLSIASHELRTPLTTIRGNVQLALRRMEKLTAQLPQQLARPDSYEQIMRGLERVHEPLTNAMQRTSVQDRMISDLLDASRIRANKLQLVVRTLDLAKLLREAVEDLRYLAPDRQVLLHLSDTKPAPIVADADRIGQVVNNYVINALRYSPAEQPVEVSLEVIEESKTARVTVRDQGSGIAPEDMEHIWDRFYRCHDTDRQYDTGAGLGLGLYISRTIIEQHNGQVGVASAKGKGSTFWFTLPLQSPENTPAENKLVKPL